MSADTSSPSNGSPQSARPGSPADEDLVGRTLAGRYRIEARLAAGGMGVVYRAEQEPLGRPVALKVLKPPGDRGMKRQFVERFLLEAASMAQLQHPNTVVIHDYGEDEGVLYFTMEYLAGETLTQRVRRLGPLEPEDAIHVAIQVASSLGDAHGMGLVHRDLKPGNVMLLERGGDRLFVKVLDFGLVKIVGEEAQRQLTQSGIILGSPRYMAPEQVRGQSLGPAADVYAFGCLLTFLLTARPPFPKGGPFEAMRAHVYEDPPALRDLDPHCIAGERLEAVVARCLQKAPEERYTTMGELADALRHAALAPRIAAASGLDLQVTFQRSSTSSAPHAVEVPTIEGLAAGSLSGGDARPAGALAEDELAADGETSRKETTPLGAAPLPSMQVELPRAAAGLHGPSRAPLGAATLPDGGPVEGPEVADASSGWSVALGEATQAWQRFRVRILLAAAAMIALLAAVSLALFLPGGPLGVPLPPERAPARATTPVLRPPPEAPGAPPAAVAPPATHDTYPVRIRSEPTGAEVLHEGVVLGDTPLALDVPADARWTLELSRAGYETRTVTIVGTPPEGSHPDAMRELRVTLLEASDRHARRRDRRPNEPVLEEPEPTETVVPEEPPTTQTIRDPWER